MENAIEKFSGWRKGAALAAFAALHVFLAPFPAEAAPIPWKHPTYTLVARDMDLRMALDTFAVAEGLSVVMSPSVAGRFSGDFNNVPAEEFLEKIATVHNLIWYYDGAALYLYGAGEIATILIDLNYMKADEVLKMLADLGVEDARFPMKSTSNDELVMVSGPPRYVRLVAEMVSRADRLREKRTHNEVESRIFPLCYTWADDISFKVNTPESMLTIKGVARILEEMMASENPMTRDVAITNNLNSYEASLMASFRPMIRAENRLNAVVVRDVVSRMPMYEKLIKQLDVPQKLIEIDVTVVELSQKDALDWQLSLALSTSRGHSDYGAGQNAGNIFGPAEIAGKGLAGALTHIHSSYALASSITALREKGKARSISRTSLLTVNNLAAEMADTQSYHAKVIGTEVASLEEVSAGTKLQVKPRILPSIATNVPNQVWLTLSLDDGGFESITVDAMPMKRTTTLQTQTAVFEEESVMLAGYFRDIEEKAGWGIPILRDLPFIGWLFGGESTRKERVQRVFIFTPHIVDLDTEMLARMQAERIRDVTIGEGIEDDAVASDEEREKRDVLRKDMRERRHEKAVDALERLKAEIGHGKNLRAIERKRKSRLLSEDIREWKAQEKAELERLKAEEAALKAQAEKEAFLKEVEESARNEEADEAPNKRLEAPKPPSLPEESQEKAE